jgi:hypothetical protein
MSVFACFECNYSFLVFFLLSNSSRCFVVPLLTLLFATFFFCRFFFFFFFFFFLHTDKKKNKEEMASSDVIWSVVKGFHTQKRYVLSAIDDAPFRLCCSTKKKKKKKKKIFFFFLISPHTKHCAIASAKPSTASSFRARRAICLANSHNRTHSGFVAACC